MSLGMCEWQTCGMRMMRKGSSVPHMIAPNDRAAISSTHRVIVWPDDQKGESHLYLHLKWLSTTLSGQIRRFAYRSERTRCCAYEGGRIPFLVAISSGSTHHINTLHPRAHTLSASSRALANYSYLRKLQLRFRATRAHCCPFYPEVFHSLLQCRHARGEPCRLVGCSLKVLFLEKQQMFRVSSEQTAHKSALYTSFPSRSSSSFHLDANSRPPATISRPARVFSWPKHADKCNNEVPHD